MKCSGYCARNPCKCHPKGLKCLNVVCKWSLKESKETSAVKVKALSEIFLICSQLFQIQPYDPPELSQVKKGINIKVKKLQDTKGDKFSRNALSFEKIFAILYLKALVFK